MGIPFPLVRQIALGSKNAGQSGRIDVEGASRSEIPASFEVRKSLAKGVVGIVGRNHERPVIRIDRNRDRRAADRNWGVDNVGEIAVEKDFRGAPKVVAERSLHIQKHADIVLPGSELGERGEFVPISIRRVVHRRADGREGAQRRARHRLAAGDHVGAGPVRQVPAAAACAAVSVMLKGKLLVLLSFCARGPGRYEKSVVCEREYWFRKFWPWVNQLMFSR